jgi:glycosyltransferase involved in cell wall biosynthesis
MKILWMSDSPLAPTGFGNVGRFVCQGLVAAGHDVYILSYEERPETTRWCGATLLAKAGSLEERLRGCLDEIRPDVLITLTDMQWLDFLTQPSFGLRKTGVRWLPYFPIEGHPADGGLVPAWRKVLAFADLPIAMSRYGRDVMRAAGLRCAYIPHGIDTATFRPPANREAAKRALGYEGKFVILSDARNQWRKRLPTLLTIFERFCRDKPDALLHLHCDVRDHLATHGLGYRYMIHRDVLALGISKQVRFTRGFSIENEGLPLGEIIKLYQSADLHVLTSLGEGFGIPTLQAAACGVPAAAVDYSANRELIEGHGLLFPVAGCQADDEGIGRALIDVESSVALLEGAYDDRARLQRWGEQARAFSLAYEWRQVLRQWNDLLETVASGDALASNHESPQGERPPHPFADTRALVDEPECPRLDIPLSRTTPLRPGAPRPAQRWGAIYLAPSPSTGAPGPLSIALFERLGEIFQLCQARALAEAVLAIDLDGSDPELPSRGAALGVPVIALATNPSQRLLWPDAALDSAEPGPALKLGRWILSDYLTAVRLTAEADRRLRAGRPGGAEVL